MAKVRPQTFDDPGWNWVKFAGFACCTADEASYRGGNDDLELIETGGAWRGVENRGCSRCSRRTNARQLLLESVRDSFSSELLRIGRLFFLLSKDRFQLSPKLLWIALAVSDFPLSEFTLFPSVQLMLLLGLCGPGQPIADQSSPTIPLFERPGPALSCLFCHTWSSVHPA